jgi:signal transduction histidine kinase
MKIVLNLVFSFFILSVALAQESQVVDSLKRQYEEEDDLIEKLELLTSICSEEPSAVQRLKHAENLLSLALEEDLPGYIHAAHLQKAIAYRLQGNLTKSLESLLSSAEIAQKIEDNKMLGQSYGEIANTFSAQGDLQNGIDYMNKALAIFREIGDSVNLAVGLLNTGYDYYTLNKLDSSLLYYDEAEIIVKNLSVTQKNLKPSLLAYIRGNRAITWMGLERYKASKKELESCISILRMLEDHYGVADYLIYLGKLEYRTDNLLKAEKHAEEALSLAEKMENGEQARDASFLMYEIQQKQNDATAALQYYIRYIEQKEKIENATTIREMADLRTRYEVDQKQAEVELLEAQKRNQRILIIAISIVLLIAMISAYLFRRNYRQKERLNAELNKQKVELEKVLGIKNKFFSIVSHDLRGPIHAFHGISQMIKFLVISKNTDSLIPLAEQIDNSVDRLSELLDNLLNWAIQEQGTLPFKKEAFSLHQSITKLIETYRTMAESKNITIESDISTDIVLNTDRNTSETIFRNVLSNALKFTPEGGTVSLSARRADQSVKISFEDTGSGIPPKKLKKLFELSEEETAYGTQGEKGLGLGLKLVREFVEMNDGKISVENRSEGGLRFTISLPAYPATVESAHVLH